MNFVPLKNDNLIRAAKGQQIDRIPIWIMRQAGRHLEEFKEYMKDKTFFEICQTPEYACEVTLQPIRRYDMDAAIIFSDILVMAQAMGMECVMVAGKGPTFPEPLSVENFNSINLHPNVKNELSYVYEAITLTRLKLDGKVPLIGFCGAPWTLMAYMIEGSGSKTYSKAKKWLYQNEQESHKLLDALTENLIEHLIYQARAGAQLLQVFESNAGYLNSYLFEKYCTPRLKQIASEVKRRLGNESVPMTIFTKDGHFALTNLADSKYDVIGVDWCTPPSFARERCNGKTLQGNLDPCALYADKEKLTKIVNEMLEEFGSNRYIANLGHGIYPDMCPTNVEYFIDAVHNYKVK